MKLHAYQEDAADRLYEADGVVCVADMGSGKTATTLAAIVDAFNDGVIDHAIIWAPKRVAQTVWAQENEKWGFGLDIAVVEGTPERRAKILAERHEVIVINYELADWLKEQGVRATDRTLAVFDEVSRLKNPKGRRRKSVMAIGGGLRWGLTGTPKGNNALDLWGQADAVCPGVWDRSFYVWRSRYFRPVDPDQHIWKPLPGCEALLDEQFARLSFKVDAPVYSDPIMLFDTVILPDRAMAQYRQFKEDLVAEIDGKDVMTFFAAGASMKMRQIASGWVYAEDGTSALAHRAKLEALVEIVEDSGENVLVFYQFLHEVEAMREMWPDLEVLGGETKNHKDVIDRWNRGEIRVLAGHPAAMGHGLNLQEGGRRAVWLSLTWSLEEYLQANARLARQGQDQQVYIHHLCAANTIDLAVSRALSQKRRAQDALMEILNET